jgi:hypothetical protein
VWSSIGSKPSGIFLYRGFTAASTAKEAEKLRDLAKKDEKKKMKEDEDKEKEGAAAPATTAADASSGTSTPAVKPPKPKDELPETLQEIMKRVKGEFESKRKAMEEANAPIRHAKNDDEPCTDLVLVIHGIGQNLAEQYESFSFIYASNQLRQVLRKQSLDPAIGSIVRNRRIQILPVQWRANLKMDSESSTEDAQYERENVFTISDITISKSIPYVREVTNSVLLDIPLFMSGHKTKMIEAVCQQANRQYRMWIARNPEFEKNGRVHVIGHSVIYITRCVADFAAWFGTCRRDSLAPADYCARTLAHAQAGHHRSQEPLRVQHAQPLPRWQPARRLPPTPAGARHCAYRPYPYIA